MSTNTNVEGQAAGGIPLTVGHEEDLLGLEPLDAADARSGRRQRERVGLAAAHLHRELVPLGPRQTRVRHSPPRTSPPTSRYIRCVPGCTSTRNAAAMLTVTLVLRRLLILATSSAWSSSTFLNSCKPFSWHSQPLKGQSYTANGQDSSCACAFVSFTVSSQPYSRNLQCLSTTARWSSHQPAPHVADRLGAGPALAVEAEAAPRAHGMPIGTLEVDI
jgi:hypothetical protein